MKVIRVALSFLAVGGCALSANPPARPANPAATPRVGAVLDYFQSLEKKTDRRVVSGQFSDFGPGATVKLMVEIHTLTGHWPGMLGVDYAHFAKGGLTWEAPNRAAIDYWRDGGLVTVSAHLYNPANPKGGGLRDSGVNLDELLQPDTETHRRWMQELDQLAEGLQELRAAGVVVLWRPFHEMNGGWFWWGAKDPAAFVRLWRHMFDYFSRTKGLDHLLWVYGPNHGERTAAYYPGDGYVDLVGLDAYTDFVDREHIRGYAEVAALPKPFGFTEYGPHGPQRPPGDYDYRRLLAGLTRDFPRTCFFMSWNGNWSLARNRNTTELLADPLIVNREDLPAGLAGDRPARSERIPPKADP
jgi:mannan endo-1,4-beta-mannosidase